MSVRYRDGEAQTWDFESEYEAKVCFSQRINDARRAGIFSSAWLKDEDGEYVNRIGRS